MGEWALPEGMVENSPPSNNTILGHVIHRLVEKSHPPQVKITISELPSFAIKGCLLGKTFSGKTTALKALQKGRISFFFFFFFPPYWILFTLTVAANDYVCRQHIRIC